MSFAEEKENKNPECCGNNCGCHDENMKSMKGDKACCTSCDCHKGHDHDKEHSHNNCSCSCHKSCKSE